MDGTLTGEIDNDGEAYSSFYKACPSLVYGFENMPPWTNFYQAIENCDIKMPDLFGMIESRDFSRSAWLFRHSNMPAATELTFRLLCVLEDVVEASCGVVAGYCTFVFSSTFLHGSIT